MASLARKRKPTTASVLDAAEQQRDPATRADVIEAGFGKVEKHEVLVKPWFAARLEVPGNRDATAERALEIANEVHDPAFLDALAHELARRAFEQEAVEVLDMALSAGSKTPMTKMLLGFELARRGEARAVPYLEASLRYDPDWSLPRKTLAAWWLEREPARTLEIIGVAADAKEHELRALACERLGRAADAARESAAALAGYDDALDARRELAEWHTQYNRHERALLHARALLELREASDPTENVEDIDQAIVDAFDDAGCFSELLPWLRSHEAFPIRVAFRVYVGLTSLVPNPDPELAMRAARDTAAGFAARKDMRQVLLWKVREAGVAAKAGDLARLDALVAADVDGDPAGWSEVAQVYLHLDDVGAAAAAADRAIEIDAASAEALIVSWQIALQVGDLETLHRVAMALVANHPRLHQGPEMLARSFARRFDALAALMHSERALAMGRHCHNAWTARAEALAVAGDVRGAREHIERSLVMRQHDEDGSDALILAAALRQEHAELDAQIAKREKKAPRFAEYYGYLRKLANR